MKKLCKTCNLEQNLSNFNKDSTRKDGHSYICKNCAAKCRKTWRSKNKDKENLRKKNYYYANKEKCLDSQNKRRKIRRKTDINFRLRENLRSRISHLIKKGSAIRDLGCSIEEFKVYIESKFQQDMNWNNYGLNGWEIDHIIPLAKFNLNNKKDLKKATHYTNLRPLWKLDNIKKSDKV